RVRPDSGTHLPDDGRFGGASVHCRGGARRDGGHGHDCAVLLGGWRVRAEWDGTRRRQAADGGRLYADATGSVAQLAAAVPGEAATACRVVVAQRVQRRGRSATRTAGPVRRSTRTAGAAEPARLPHAAVARRS